MRTTTLPRSPFRTYTYCSGLKGEAVVVRVGTLPEPLRGLPFSWSGARFWAAPAKRAMPERKKGNIKPTERPTALEGHLELPRLDVCT